MRTGTIKFFNEAKGYGFITDTTSLTDHFVHITALSDEVKDLDLKEGCKVAFEIIQTDRGSNAIDVRLEH